jgi:Fe-S cluster assembly protein SufD
MITQVSSSLYQQLVGSFEDPLFAKEVLEDRRKEAFEKFKNTGFPTAKAEEWRFTNIQPVLNENYQLGAHLPGQAVNVNAANIEGVDAYRVVLVNGVYRHDLSDTIEEQGIILNSFANAVQSDVFNKHFAQYADKAENPFVWLNTALSNNGFFIEIQAGKVAQKPIHVIHISVADSQTFYQTRNLIVVERNAEAQIIETFITENGSSKTFGNTVTEIVVDENAKLEHYYLQQASSQSSFNNHTEIIQRKYSLYNNYNCTFPGASFVRNTINVRMDDPSIESHLYGITLLSDNQLVDNHTVVDHMKPHGESYEWYKNILQDSSTAVFNGKIFVRLDAQKTNAFQQNNNMLLSGNATINTKPQLEIFADDVKCSHGCTIGQFNEDAKFYLQARGIGEEQARTLLVHAFAFDVTERFKNETIRSHVDHLVELGLKHN